MNMLQRSLVYLCIGASASSAAQADVKAKVQDAFVSCDASRTSWSIGTAGIRADFLVKDGKFLMTGLTNLTVKPAKRYLSSANAICPLTPAKDNLPYSQYQFQTLWSTTMAGAQTADMSAANLSLTVHKGDMIGFAVGAHGDFACDQIDWPITVAYANGEEYLSSDDKQLVQGPVWSYLINILGTNYMLPMNDMAYSDNTKQNIRVPERDTGYRSAGVEPHIGPNVMHPANDCDAVRVWTAPMDGTVTLSGMAKPIGGGTVDLKVMRIQPKPTEAQPSTADTDGWKLLSAEGRNVIINGRPAVELEYVMMHDVMKVTYRIMAYPGTPILRQSTVVQNTDNKPASLSQYSTMLALDLDLGDKPTDYWMIGGNREANEGKLYSAQIGADYVHNLRASATFEFVPWSAWQRQGESGDGLFIAPDYLGSWQISTTRESSGRICMVSHCRDLRNINLAAGESREMPYLTIGMFANNLDHMAKSLYDWQYEYMWDYTHDNWYARMPFTVGWYGDSDNSQQQFTGHLGDLDMNWTDYIQQVGMDTLWEDAGWSATHHWWEANFEGPDFAQTRRFLDKNDMKLTVWMQGHVSRGLLDSKVAAWGDFQRRTDGMGFDYRIDRSFRADAENFLNDNPRSSFHTCSGGSTYAHTFEVQRYTDVNYDTDAPGGDYTNAYWSYLETPDKWFDNLNAFIPNRGYYTPTAMRFLTQVPKWGIYISDTDIIGMRKVCDTYRYMKQVGVAGRWSYIVHPVIKGDDERHYCQRLNYDHSKSIIILKHQSTGEVTVYPAELKPMMNYLVEFEKTPGAATRTGADLMKNGITIVDQKTEELIYLNMPNRPRGGHDKTAPKQPSSVFTKRETNIGYAGVGVYWSPGTDNNWISCYEVKRGDQIIAKVATGNYYFDRSADWDTSAQYLVRTVDGDGNVSAWASSKSLADDRLEYQALGGFFPQKGRQGWSAEANINGAGFTAMVFIPAEHPAAADYGGTTIQPGGAEGYWQGASTARVGRGWQQASLTAECSRTWTAAVDGQVRVVGLISKELYHRGKGEALRVKITLNNQQVWPSSGWQQIAADQTVGVSHHLTMHVVKGDVLRFVLDRGANPDDDIIAWMPAITYIDTRAADRASVVRIRCGASKDYTDANGVIWTADSFFNGGKAISGLSDELAKKNHLELFQYGRTGSRFGYSIPVKPGVYCVRLRFYEPQMKYILERPFNLTVNGKQVLDNFDINQAARGSQKVYDRLVRYIVPNGDGRIDLQFTGGWEPTQKSSEALIQAIEVTPETKPCVRIDAGSDTDYVDWNGFVYDADAHYQGGDAIKAAGWVEHATPTLYDQGIYHTARSGRSFSYRVILPDGLYSIHLKFAELWLKEQGQRPMDIEINGKLVRKGFDPATQAGKVGMSADIRFDDIIPDSRGLVTIKLMAVGANDAILQGIEIE